MPNFEFKKGTKYQTKGNKDNKDNYFDTFEVGNLNNKDPYSPLKLGGTVNIIKRLLGLEYEKKDRKNRR